MRLLLDSPVLLLWLVDSPRLSARARRLVGDPETECLWSAASTWELALELAAGRLSLPEPLEHFVPRVLREQALTPLPVHHAHAARLATLPELSADPFDRVLVAQAQVEGVPLLAFDPRLAAYDVEILW